MVPRTTTRKVGVLWIPESLTRDALGDLEPDGQMVHGAEECRFHQGGKTGRGQHATFAQHRWTDSCVMRTAAIGR